MFEKLNEHMLSKYNAKYLHFTRCHTIDHFMVMYKSETDIYVTFISPEECVISKAIETMGNLDKLEI